MAGESQQVPQSAPDPTVLTTEAVDKAIANSEKLTDAKLEGTHEFCVQRFEQVKNEFELVERQRVEQKADTKAAVDAALASSKEAVRDQTSASDRTIRGLEQTIGDLKDRVVTIEALKIGAVETVDTRHQTTMQTMAIVMAVLAGLSLAVAAILIGTG